ncbi:flagellin domain protein [Methylobacterium sp. 4-46]|uniref:flagellin N-terminal helical domain-containing protein n=1 Tax=unclassified Methylobacterium TaxID=2615210 RepID=UPI000152EA65|nr:MULTISPECIES: flagellin [Methylobacterium]ACA18303.1 flagellin domain protein [Methylobacterium sp. 4-46]WFT77602.1 flagellin [Methylobacterium nodulans]
MTSLLTNSAAMTALTTLKLINANLDTTSNRVSTGQRVSAAADNAAYWSIATAVRSDNASLGAVKDSLGLGASAVGTAYNGINSIISDLQNIRAKLQTALQGGTDRSKVQTEISAIQNKMKATADSSVSNGVNWLSVDSSATNARFRPVESVVAGFARNAAGTVSFSTIDVNVNAIKLYDVNATSITSAATQAQFTAGQSLTGTPLFTNGTADFSGTNEVNFTLQIDRLGTAGGAAGTAAGAYGGKVNIVLNNSTLITAANDRSKVTTDEFLRAINNVIGASTLPQTGAGGSAVAITTGGLKGLITAALDSSGRLVFRTTDTGATLTATLTVGTATAGNTLKDFGFGTTAGLAATGKGTDAGTTTARGIIDTSVGSYDASFGGGSYSIANFDISKLVGTAGDSNLKDIIAAVDKALAAVTDAGTKLGAGKNQIEGQTSFVDSLMKANTATIGTLVDADIEEESTKLKALQTQQQLAVQALSIANSSGQALLTLFR